ncbi:MAG: cysteine desulfurase [Deltaproteobacteria bacterium]|nr:cysteine desulfurase [Deltaproteobacteria bacterium]
MTAAVDRADFPLLHPVTGRVIEGRPVIYLDSAATSLKPRAVLDAVAGYDTRYTANVHRAKHTLSEEASQAFQDGRGQVAALIKARPRDLVFTSGTTAAINLVALGLGFPPGSNVVGTVQDHHSNLLPWYQRAEVRLCPVDESGTVDVDRLLSLVDGNTRIVAIGHASNATGAVQPIRAIADALAGKAPLLVDGAQSVPHLPIDVAALGCDFLAFSAHKMLGPTGIGALWGKAERLEALGTPLVGGGMVDVVTATGFTTKSLPYRLEPGTPHIEGAIGFGAAAAYLMACGMDRVAAHDALLAERLVHGLAGIPGTRLLGPPPGEGRLALASLVIDRKVAADHVAMILSDTYKVMARSGHHCCHPYFDAVHASGALRLSAYLYNTVDEVDTAVAAVREILATV